jgi:hypothetical protein
LLSSQEWLAYFRVNATALMELPWDCGAELTDDDWSAVVESIREFQLGESSEGRHLLRAAHEYAFRTGDHDYVKALRLFIAEEQRHARDLGRFLTLAGVSLKGWTWPDQVFRWLRHRAGLEVSIAVLVTAEVIAKVYYGALKNATGSRVLRRLCDQILSDEVEHVRFQSQRLAVIRDGRRALYLSVAHTLQRFLFAGTILVVWSKHAPALRAGAIGLRDFWRLGWHEMNQAIRAMDPRSYEI